MGARFAIFFITIFLLSSLIGFFYFGSTLNKIAITSDMVQYLSNVTQSAISEKLHTFAKNVPVFSIGSGTHNSTTTEFNETINDWMEQMEQKYRKINDRIRKVCHKYREKGTKERNVNVSYIERNILKNIMLDAENKLAYCRHGKVKSISN